MIITALSLTPHRKGISFQCSERSFRVCVCVSRCCNRSFHVDLSSRFVTSTVADSDTTLVGPLLSISRCRSVEARVASPRRRAEHMTLSTLLLLYELGLKYFSQTASHTRAQYPTLLQSYLAKFVRVYVPRPSPVLSSTVAMEV